MSRNRLLSITDKESADIFWYVGLALLLVAPMFVYPLFLMNALCFALFAMGFNLVFGFGGMLSFGHAAFFGLAAYGTGYVIKNAGWPVEAGILFGVGLATAVGFVFGALATRRSGIYLAMITFGLSEIVYFFAAKSSLTGGENGLTRVPRGKLLGVVDLTNEMAMYYTTLLLFVIGFACFVRIIRSPFGEALKAIKENERRATSLGYSVRFYKLTIFTLSAAFAGLAGALKVLVLEFASLADVHWLTSGVAVLMTLVGGVGTFVGPVVGAFLIQALNDYLSFLGQWVTIVIGLVFILTVLVFRRGIVGEIFNVIHRLAEKKNSQSEKPKAAPVAKEADAA